jgi:molybdenum cofactor cytidylyltransferase
MVVPRVGDAPGNPVIFEATLRDQWLTGEANGACRRWRDAHPERVRWFDTDNARYRLDIDTPDDLARFAATTGHELRWPAEVLTP